MSAVKPKAIVLFSCALSICILIGMSTQRTIERVHTHSPLTPTHPQHTLSHPDPRAVGRLQGSALMIFYEPGQTTF